MALAAPEICPVQSIPKSSFDSKPVPQAVALRYTPDLPAPFVIAKGRDQLAKRIRELAKQLDIPLVEDRELTDALYRVEIAEYIPEELYQAVAEILAFISTLD